MGILPRKTAETSVAPSHMPYSYAYKGIGLIFFQSPKKEHVLKNDRVKLTKYQSLRQLDKQDNVNTNKEFSGH